MTDIRRPSSDTRRVVAIGVAIIAITFGILGLWAALVPLGSAVIGHGSVAVQSNRQTIQHFEGGIVSKILVHEGDHVNAGQVLFELSPVQADAALASARNQLFSLLAKSDRLSAERDGRAQISFSPEVRAQAGDPLVQRAMGDETTEFDARRANLADQVAVLNARIAELKTQISGIDVQRQGMQQQVAYLDDEIGGLTQLYQKDLVPKPRILALERDRAQLKGQIGGSIADKARAQESIGETTQQINQLREQFFTEVSKDLSDTQTQIADVRQKYAVAQDAASRVNVTAPMSGVIQNLKVFTVGGVVRPGEPMVDIAPDKGAMIIEARFSPNDVDSIHAGQTVQVRFSTFHSRTIPIINGTIRSVSQDRLVDEMAKTSYYMAIVDVPEGNLPAELKGKLRAGMPVEVIAPTGQRTALQYIFRPLSNALTGAMREK
ncbi:MAG TPA: HlyD family type I secretion periplasmic adaptor subunit [Caulobacteraceae bacterium]|jgi:HlyD family type I secretion membrane fusion protein|nr:HlyD family type I secretion periplasmic adaptor subunit [Caulobacteraceae bacterium]